MSEYITKKQFSMQCSFVYISCCYFDISNIPAFVKTCYFLRASYFLICIRKRRIIYSRFLLTNEAQIGNQSVLSASDMPDP